MLENDTSLRMTAEVADMSEVVFEKQIEKMRGEKPGYLCH
jgi:hypothetical protein